VDERATREDSGATQSLAGEGRDRIVSAKRDWREAFMKHLQSVEQLSSAEINEILSLAKDLKFNRGKEMKDLPLKGQTWALIFNKASTRTRVSFEVGIRELGGNALYLSRNDIQMGRGETVADTARTISRYVHGVVIRTFAQSDIE